MQNDSGRKAAYFSGESASVPWRKEIMLTRKEFDLLLLFAENPNKVFTCDQLYDLLWSEQTAYNVDEVVKAHIKSLRQKLSDDDSVQIKNVWGVGYRFCYNRK